MNNICYRSLPHFYTEGVKQLYAMRDREKIVMEIDGVGKLEVYKYEGSIDSEDIPSEVKDRYLEKYAGKDPFGGSTEHDIVKYALYSTGAGLWIPSEQPMIFVCGMDILKSTVTKCKQFCPAIFGEAACKLNIIPRSDRPAVQVTVTNSKELTVLRKVKGIDRFPFILRVPNLVKATVYPSVGAWEVYFKGEGFPHPEQPNLVNGIGELIRTIKKSMHKQETPERNDLDLTEQEQIILDKSSELWNMIIKLPEEHPQDNIEYNKAIHDIQYRIMARPLRREINK